MSEHDAIITVRLFDEDKNYAARHLLIDNVEHYLRLENKLLKSYRSQDITHICQWFEENQRQFGASCLLEVGIYLYCEELCKVYSHRKRSRLKKWQT